MNRPGPFPDFSVPISALQGELNRLIEHYWPIRPPGAAGPSAERPSATWTPAVDLYETADEVVLLADLPGVNPSGIDLTVDGRLLTLRGEKPPGTAEGPASSDLTRERSFGPFHRQITLPSEVNADGVRANVHSGVLEVHLPKTESARSRTIPIQPA
ncbi:MAG TPA: Hsp20/alpha crystallin family protein [Isosphaeraceae bacterium]|jgi:HSP20 family protein|nr:Hsp20/alpha crystallin family protein [Isosphaeraceae bacterium]